MRALDLITDSLLILGVNADGQVPSASQGAQGLRWLNQIIGQWSLMSLTIPAIAREVFDLEAGRGGPSDPYTIGPGGDFDTSRPPSITSVGLLDSSQTTPFEITRSLFTTDAYASITEKEETSNYFSGLYYSPTFAEGLATIYLYPVPSVDTTSLVLYRPVQLSEFDDLTTDYDLPPGAAPALTYELAKFSAIPNGKPWLAHLDAMRNELLSVYQRGNTQMSDLGVDPALTQQSGLYNILSDSLSGFRGR